MRKIILLSILCIATWSFTEAKKNIYPAQQSDATVGKINPVYERSEQRAQELGKVSLRNTLVGQLDSIVYQLPDGTNNIKHVYEYDEDYFDVSEKQYNWDNGKWTIAKVFNYEWDKTNAKALLTAYEDLGYSASGDGTYVGTRMEYTYDDNGFVDSKIKFSIENGNRTPQQKVTYVNDARGNAVEKYQYNYIETNWQIELKTLAEYDNQNRETEVENYEWNSGWIGIDKFVYEYDPVSGDYTLQEYPKWDNVLQVWVNFRKIMQAFDNGKLVEKGEYFWNEDAQDWIGSMVNGDWAYCTKSTLTYNASGLQTSETFFRLKQDGTSWETLIQMDITYDPVIEEPGYYMYERKVYFNVNDDMEQQETLKYKYYVANVSHISPFEHKPLPENSVVVYAYEYNSKTLDGYEYYYSYDNNLNLVEDKEYIYEEGDKLSDKWNFMNYDANKNMTKLIVMYGDGSADGWVNSSMSEYEFGTDNIKTREYEYSYANDEWVKESGSGLDMDYNVLSSQLVVNLGYDNPYKITYQYVYENDGSNQWATNVGTFYYTSMTGTSVKNAQNTLFSVSPNPVADIVTINSDEENVQVNLYNVQGVKLLQTNEKQIDMSEFSAGIYVLEINGVKVKVMKR